MIKALENVHDSKMEKERIVKDKYCLKSRSESPGKKISEKRRMKKEKRKKKDDEKGTKIKLKEKSNPCIVPTLRLLIALEDYLGSIGKALIGLLTEALRMEKDRPGSSNDLLALERTTLTIETAKQKLKGGIEAELIPGRAIKATKKAIARARALLKSVKAEAGQQMEPVTSCLPVEDSQRNAIRPKLDVLLDTNATDLLDLISDTIPDNIIATLTEDSPEDTPKIDTNTRRDNSIAEEFHGDASSSNSFYISMNVSNFFQDNEVTDEKLFSLLNKFELLSSVEQMNLVKYLATLEPARVDKLKEALAMAVTRYDCLNPNATSHVAPTTSASNPLLQEQLDTQPSNSDLAMHAKSLNLDGTNNSPDSDVEILVPMPIDQKEDEHAISSEGLDLVDPKRVHFKLKTLATQPVNSMKEELLKTNDACDWTDDDFTDKMAMKKKKEDTEGETEGSNKNPINSISSKKFEIIKLLESVDDPDKAEKIYKLLKDCSKENVEEVSAVSSTTDSLRHADVEADRPYCVLCQSNTHKLRDCILRNKHLCMVCQTYGYRTPNCPECSVSRVKKSRYNSERIRTSFANKPRSSDVYCSSNKYRKPMEKTRYSQYSSSYRHQRTYPTSVDRYHLSPSSDRRKQTRSTDEQWKNRSPTRRRRRSPIERHRSRSSNRLRSRSPSERRRNRSPSRLNSRSPRERRRSRSPSRLKSRSPRERRRSRSPSRLKSRSPRERRRSSSPSRLKSRSSRDRRRSRSPSRLKSRSPRECRRSRSPSRLKSRSSRERHRSRSPSRLKSRSPIERRSRSPNRYKKSSSRDDRRKSQTPSIGKSSSPDKYLSSLSLEKQRSKIRPSQNEYRNDIDKFRKSSDSTPVTPYKYQRSSTPDINLFIKGIKYSETYECTPNRSEENKVSCPEKQLLTKPKQMEEAFMDDNKPDQSKQQPKKFDSFVSTSDIIDLSLYDVKEEKPTGILKSRATRNTVKMLIDPNELTPNPSDIATTDDVVECLTDKSEIALGIIEDISEYTTETADNLVSNKLVVDKSDNLKEKTQLSLLIKNESRNEIYLEHKPVDVVNGREPAEQTEATNVSQGKENNIMHQKHDLDETKVPENVNNVAKDACNKDGYKIDVRICTLKNTETINKVTQFVKAESNDNDMKFQKNESINVGNLIVCQTKEQENTKKTTNTVKTVAATNSESVANTQKCLNSHARNVANLIVCKTKADNTNKKTSKSINEVNLDTEEKAESVKSHQECHNNEVTRVDNSIVSETGDKSTVKPTSLKKKSQRRTQRHNIFCPRCRVNTHALKACPAPRKVICFGCGMDGVSRSKCPNCREVRLQKSYTIPNLNSYLSNEFVSHKDDDVIEKTTVNGDIDI